MKFEPQKFFIGLIDFFSVFLPGALLTYLVMEDAKCWLGQAGFDFPTGAEGWIAFLFSSYLLGHFIFLIGSEIDSFYGFIRDATYLNQIKNLSDGKDLSSGFARGLAGKLFKKHAGQAVFKVEKVRDHYLKPLDASTAVNCFQWCKARLTLTQPEALATVQRFEADSKFFRSLIVILFILIPWSYIKFKSKVPLLGLLLPFVGIVFLFLSFWRYAEQRLKSTDQAYWFVLAQEARGVSGFRQATDDRNGHTHAGGVVIRKVKKEDETKQGKLKTVVEFLLVQAKKNPEEEKEEEEWVLPKGHIEIEEPIKETAVREVREESGVWAKIKEELKSVSFVSRKNEIITVQYYLMEHMETGKPGENRKREWLELEAALKKNTPPQVKDVLRQAARKLGLKLPGE